MDKHTLYKELGRLRELTHILDKDMRLVYADGLRLTEHADPEDLPFIYSQYISVSDAMTEMVRLTALAKNALTHVQVVQAALPARLQKGGRSLTPAEETQESIPSACSVVVELPCQPSPEAS